MNPIMRLFVKGHVWLYRTSGGTRGATMQGKKVVLLTTRGRKSGVARTVPIIGFFEGDQVYVIASMGGAPSHPAWFRNLEANPDVDVQIGPKEWHARAVVVPGAERDRLWSLITADMPNFAEYQKKTTRVIPVVHLVPVS